ncbi:MAG: hypothetical protein VYA84_06995, partial [Planctomycetota bacterium]|nr:hypothetical protein [Planctomycetota bacterium]
VNDSDNSIYVGRHAFRTGTLVQYNANDNNPIGPTTLSAEVGLTDLNDYFVITIPEDPNRIKLARTAFDARNGNAISLKGDGEANNRNRKDFDAGQVRDNAVKLDNEAFVEKPLALGAAVKYQAPALTFNGDAFEGDKVVFDVTATNSTQAREGFLFQEGDKIRFRTNGGLAHNLTALRDGESVFVSGIAAADEGGGNYEISFSLEDAAGNTLSLDGAADAWGHYQLAGPEVGGLVHGDNYYVVTSTDEENLDGDNAFVDSQVIRLARTEPLAFADIHLNLDASSIRGTHHLYPTHLRGGGLSTLGVIAELETSQGAGAESGVLLNNATDSPIGNIAGKAIGFNLFERFGKPGKENGIYNQGNYSTADPTEYPTGITLAFGYTENEVNATVLPSADLQSGQHIEIVSDVMDRYQVHSMASLDFHSDGTNVDEGKTATAFALGIGVVNNESKAEVQTGATLDASQATRVISEIRYPYLQRPDEFVPTSMREFTNSLEGESAGTATDPIASDVQRIEAYLDGTGGLQSFLFNTWATSSANVTDADALSAAINLFFHTNTSEAIVHSSVKINQRSDLHNDTDGMQSVQVEAYNFSQTINLVGNFKFRTALFDDIFSWRYECAFFCEEYNKRMRRRMNPVSGFGDNGFGGVVMHSNVDNITTARVKEQAELSAGQQGGVSVKAEEGALNFYLAQSGSGSFGSTHGDTYRPGFAAISGTVSVAKRKSRTDAIVERHAKIQTIGMQEPDSVSDLDIPGMPILVKGVTMSLDIGWAGAVTLAENAGVGFTVVINEQDRRTRAIIGDKNVGGTSLDTAAPGKPDATSHTNGPITVLAKSDGKAYTMSQAAAFSGLHSSDSRAPSSSVAAKAKYGVGASANVTVSDVKDDVVALIRDYGTLTAGSVAVVANGNYDSTVYAGAASVLLPKAGLQDKRATLAGSVAVNNLRGDVTAQLDTITLLATPTSRFETLNSVVYESLGANLTSVAVRSTTTNTLLTIATGFGVAVSSDSTSGAEASTDLILAGSVAINNIDADATAKVVRVSDVLSAGASDYALDVNAQDQTQVRAVAGTLSAGYTHRNPDIAANTLSVGFSFAQNEIGNSVEARVEATDVSITTATVEARSRKQIHSVAVSGSGATGASTQVLFAGSFARNVVYGGVIATVMSSSVLKASGAVSVRATNEKTKLRADAGGFSFALSDARVNPSKYKFSGTVGASEAFNQLGRSKQERYGVEAQVNGSEIESSGSISIEATSAAEIEALGMGGALAISQADGESVTGAITGAGAGAHNEVYMHVLAGSSDSTLTAGLASGTGSLNVFAIDNTELVSDAGGVAVSVSLAKGTADTATGNAGAGAVGVGVATNIVMTDTKASLYETKVDADSVSVKAESSDLDHGHAQPTINGQPMDIRAIGLKSIQIEDTTDKSNPGAATFNGDSGVLTISGNFSGDASNAGQTAADANAFDIEDAINAIPGFVARGVVDAGTPAMPTDLDVDRTKNTKKLHALAFGVAGGGSQSNRGLAGAFAGAGSVAHNTIDNRTEALVKMSSLGVDGADDLTASGAFTVNATDDSEISADSGGYAVALAFASNAGANKFSGGGAIGASIAVNEVGKSEHYTKAYIQNLRVSAEGGTDVTATSAGKIDALSIGAAGTGSLTEKSVFNLVLSAGGAGSTNIVDKDVKAYAEDSEVVVTGTASLNIDSNNLTQIEADAGGVAVAISHVRKNGVAGNFSGTIGVAKAENTISVDNKSFLKNSVVDLRGGSLHVTADSGGLNGQGGKSKIKALAFGVALSSATIDGTGKMTGALAGAGSGSVNNIDIRTEASITDTDDNQDNEVNIVDGKLTVRATDETEIQADAGGYAIAIAGGRKSLGAGAIGASVSENRIGKGDKHYIKAFLQNVDINMDRGVDVVATSGGEIKATTIGAAGSGSGGRESKYNLVLAAGGAGSFNEIDKDVLAYAVGSTIDGDGSVSGNVTIDSNDHAEIMSDAGGIALAISIVTGGEDGGSLSGSIGVANAENYISVDNEAYLDDTSVKSYGDVSITADSADSDGTAQKHKIDALALGVAASIASNSGEMTGALAGAGSGATNRVDIRTMARIKQTSKVDDDEIQVGGSGKLQVRATDNSSVRADGGGYTLALAFPGGGGPQGFGGGAGVIGAAVSRNFIGGEDGHSTVAKIVETGLTLTGDATVRSSSRAKIDSLTLGVAGSGALSGSDDLIAISASGGGAESQNDIQSAIHAFVSQSTLNSSGKLTIAAQDLSKITADAGGGALAVLFATGDQSFEGSLSVGVAVATNTINSDVSAQIRSSKITVKLGIDIDAISKAQQDNEPRIDAVALGLAASAAAVLDGNVPAGALAGAGSGTENKIDVRLDAGITDVLDPGNPSGFGDPSEVISGGEINILSKDQSKIRAESGGFSLAAAGAPENAFGVGLSGAKAINEIGLNGGHRQTSYIKNAEVRTHAGLISKAENDAEIDALAMSGAFAFGGGGSGNGFITIGAAAAGAGTVNKIKTHTDAMIKKSTVRSGGSLELDAVDDSYINGDAGGIAVGIALNKGNGAGGGSFGFGLAENTISNTVRSRIEESDLIAKTAELEAKSTAHIKAYVAGGAGGLAAAQNFAIAAAGAGGVATNTITNKIQAYVQGSEEADGPSSRIHIGADSGSGEADHLRIRAIDASKIDAKVHGGAVTVGVGTAIGGGAISISVAEATNKVENTVEAFMHDTNAIIRGTFDVEAKTTESVIDTE